VIRRSAEIKRSGFLHLQIRRSAEIKRSGFLHMPGSRKTDGIASNQWRIGIRSCFKNIPPDFFGKKSLYQKRYCSFEYGKIRFWHLAKSQNFLPPDIFKTASKDALFINSISAFFTSLICLWRWYLKNRSMGVFRFLQKPENFLMDWEIAIDLLQKWELLP